MRDVMKWIQLFTVLSLTFSTSASAAEETIAYELGGTQFEARLIYNEAAVRDGEMLPGIVMIPNWMGPSENAYEKARMLAGDRYAVFVADMYGVDVRPTNASEAGKAAGFVRADRLLMRERSQKAVDVFHGLAKTHPINPDKTIAIGFCFGGGTVLELARSGTESVRGVISFHGDLKSPLQANAEAIQIPLLVLHGADDPYVPKEDVDLFIESMHTGEVDDWTLVHLSGAVHSFTNPAAQSDGARYDERAASRAFNIMEIYADDWLD